MIKAVLDTNILVSGLISSKSYPFRIIQSWHQNKFILVVSAEILQEVKRVLNYPKIRKNYCLTKRIIEQYFYGFQAFSQICQPIEKINLVADDPDDNKFVEAAVSGQVDFLVSGDHHLLNIKQYQNIKIITAKKFVQILTHP